MPCVGRDFDARAAATSVSTRSVSPWNIGAGNATSLNPRLATVVPRVVSWTLIPITIATVNIEFTIGRPNSVSLAA